MRARRALGGAHLTVLIVFASLSSGQERVPAVLLATTPNSRIEQSARVVVRDAAEWARYQERIGISPGSGPTTPAVDFERDMVILVAMGQKPTGGYEIEVTQVLRAESSLTVTVTETAPGRSCMTTQAFTAPAAAVRVPRVTGEVRFTEAQRTRECR